MLPNLRALRVGAPGDDSCRKRERQEETRLMIAWDYDQCLSVVVHRNPAASAASGEDALRTHVVETLKKFINDNGVTDVMLCSYSNRVSDDYNVNQQPVKHHTFRKAPSWEPGHGPTSEDEVWRKPNIEALRRMRDLLFKSGVTRVAVYGDYMTTRDDLCKTTAGDRSIKIELYKTIMETARRDESYKIVLFIDDKQKSLDFIRSDPNRPECFCWLLHGSHLAKALLNCKDTIKYFRNAYTETPVPAEEFESEIKSRCP